jgi:hypothetical protein
MTSLRKDGWDKVPPFTPCSNYDKSKIVSVYGIMEKYLLKLILKKYLPSKI